MLRGNLGLSILGLGVAGAGRGSRAMAEWRLGVRGIGFFADNFVIIDKQTAGVSYWYPPFSVNR